MATAPRLYPVPPGDLTGDAAELYGRYADGRRAAPDASFSLVLPDGALTGPPAAWLLSPRLGLGLERLGYGTRFDLGLSDRAREIVILLVAADEDNDFERYAHQQAARRAGLGDEEIRALDAGEFAPRDEIESRLVETTRTLLRTGTLDESSWAAAEEGWGRSAIFEIVTLIGWYRLVALQLRVFHIEPPG
jgi:hypothetical protein